MQAPEPSSGNRKQDILRQALTRRTPQERAAFLDGACGDDAGLRAEMESMLAGKEGNQETVPLNAGAPGLQMGGVSIELKPTLLDETPMTEGPGTVIGRYKLLEQIGEGGFGVVYLAEQREPVKRRVALKIIKLGMDTRQVVARFEAERQSLALMDHPNIAKVFDAGATENGRPYFVMELVRGIRVTDYCDQNNLPTGERLDLFLKVCQAIQHAHQKGIIHRDIKPSNILVALDDGVPVPKVIDFGIAKATAGQTLTGKTLFTAFEQFIGTPAYMSPEQAEMSGLDIDTRSDIYSLGVLLYELLVGSTPFDAKDLMSQGIDAMRKTIREKEPMRPSTRLATLQGEELTTTAKQRSADTSKLLHQLKGDLDWIVMKCLEKDRTRRYETANGLAADLKRHLQNEVVIARPPSAAYRFQKAWRRNKLAYTAGAVITIALAAGVLGTSVGLFHATRERANAEREARRATAAGREATDAAAALETHLYFNRVALAHRESTSQPANVRLAEQLLQECPARLRDWEWHYLKRRRYQAPLELREFGDQKVHCVAFSSNGRYLAAGGSDGKVKIWDLVGPRLERTLSNHTGFVVSVAFSPGNPAWIASAGSDNQLRLWDWQAGREVRSWPANTTKDYGLAYAVAFSPDGGRLAAPGETNSMLIHDIASGEIALTLSGHEEGARCVAFQGNWIATGSGQASVNLWDATTGQLIKKFGSKGPPITGVAFTRDPLRLVALQIDGTVRRWELEPPRELPSYTIRQAGSPTVGLAVHPRAGRFVTAGLDRLVTVSEPDTGRQTLVLRELTSACYSLALSPDGNRLAAASRSGSVHVWDATPLAGMEDPSFRTLQYPSDEAWALDLAPDGRSLAAGGYALKNHPRAPVVVWGIPGFDAHRELPGHSFIVFSMAYDPTGHFLATSGDEPLQMGKAKLKVWNLETQQEAFDVEAFQTDERFFSVGFSRDGRWLVGGGNSRKLRVWAATTGRTIGTLGEHTNEVTKLTFSPDGRLLASMGNDDVVNLWDATRLEQPQLALRQFSGLCAGVADLLAFSADSDRLAIVTSDDTATIHDLVGGDRSVRLTLRGHRPVALAFSPDGRWVASGGVDCTLRIWDAQTGRLQDTFRSHVDQVTRLRFLKRPDGVWLISSSRDGTVKFWDMAVLDKQPTSP